MNHSQTGFKNWSKFTSWNISFLQYYKDVHEWNLNENLHSFMLFSVKWLWVGVYSRLPALNDFVPLQIMVRFLSFKILSIDSTVCREKVKAISFYLIFIIRNTASMNEAYNFHDLIKVSKRKICKSVNNEYFKHTYIYYFLHFFYLP